MRKSTRAAVVGGTVLALSGAGIAFAVWTTDGSGTATATATSAKSLSISGALTEGLYPTGTFQVPYTVSNPNPYKVQLSSITLDPSAITVDPSFAGSCKNFGISGANGTTGNTLPTTAVVPAGTPTNPGTVSGTFTISVSNLIDNGCQNAPFTLPLTARGASSN